MKNSRMYQNVPDGDSYFDEIFIEIQTLGKIASETKENLELFMKLICCKYSFEKETQVKQNQILLTVIMHSFIFFLHCVKRNLYPSYSS